MKVYILTELDSDCQSTTINVYKNKKDAKIAEKEAFSMNTNDWYSYNIEEHEVVEVLPITKEEE